MIIDSTHEHVTTVISLDLDSSSKYIGAGAFAFVQMLVAARAKWLAGWLAWDFGA